MAQGYFQHSIWTQCKFLDGHFYTLSSWMFEWFTWTNKGIILFHIWLLTMYVKSSLLYIYDLTAWPGIRKWSLSRRTPSFRHVNSKLTLSSCLLQLLISLLHHLRFIICFQVSVAWGIGLIIGPALGGFLAQVILLLVLLF